MSDSDLAAANGERRAEEQNGSPADATPDLSMNGEDSDADLFGDGDDDDLEQPKPMRKLEDADLDSGDDEGRDDRVAQTVEEDDAIDDEEVEKAKHSIGLIEMARITPPEAKELFLLNMPPFLGLNQKAYNPDSFEVPTRPHDADVEDNEPVPANFSSFDTALSTIRWRRSPNDKSQLQSNARIIRWSDGSLTLQLASRPKDQYRISTQALRQTFNKPKHPPTHSQPDYDPSKDAQVYLAAYHEEGDLTEIVAPLDAALKILPTGDLADESVLKLQQSLAATMNVHDPLTALKQIKEDPELARLRAEQFDKELQRGKRRREAAEDKLLTRRERVLGRGGLGGGPGGGRAGLSIEGLEDEDGAMGLTSSGPGAAGSNRRKSDKSAKRRKTNRRGIIYSDDEDEGMPRGRTREDEYDEDDGFLVGSDEELETYESGEEGDEGEIDGEGEEDDPDVDDLEIEGRQTVVGGSTRGGERDRNRDEPALGRERERDGAREMGVGRDERRRTPTRDEGEIVGDGERPTSQGSPNAGRKIRRVIDDDDDE